jgi:hypothetical protein
MAVNTITGTTGNDLLQGQQLSGTQNLINGLAGNDTLLAATVADSLNGGAGNDSLSYGTGLTVNGAVAVGGNGDDSFFAVGTTLLTSSFSGESGNDLFNFTAATNLSSVSVRGGEGNDTITVQTGNLAVTFNGFAATLGQGNDVFTVGTGAASTNVQVFGGKGSDTLTLAGTYNAASVGGNENADRIFFQGAGVTLTNTFIGAGEGHDVISTTAAGAQVISTLGTVVGGKGLDTISLNNLSALSNFQIWGDTTESGDSTIGNADFIVLSANSAGAAGLYASVYGGAGDDTIQLLNVTAGAGTGVSLQLFGGVGNDSIAVNAAAANSLIGGAGNDTLIGNFQFTAGSLYGQFYATGSYVGFNGGTGVDRVALLNTSGVLMTAGYTGAGIQGVVVGNFTDSGDNILWQGVAGNTANFSGVNFLLTGAQAVAAQAAGGTAQTITGAFVYNITGGLSSIAVSGLKLGDINIYEANGDTILQVLNTTEYTAAAAFGVGDVIGTATTAGAFAAGNNQIYNFVLSGNLGVINNGTAGYISKTGVNLTFGIASDTTLGRNGFTITVV